MTLLALSLVPCASAADVHLEVTSDDGAVNVAEAWPNVETLNKKAGPFTLGKTNLVWSITAEPSVFDALNGKYLMVVTSCVKWSKNGKGDEHCEKHEFSAGPSKEVVVERELKGKGLKLSYAVSAWYTGDTPAVGLPAPEPRPIPGE